MVMENTRIRIKLSTRDNLKKDYSMEWDVYQMRKERPSSSDTGLTVSLQEM